MRNLKSIEEFLSEAISLKMYKENLPKKYWYKKSTAYKKWDKIFGKGVNRISIPIKNSTVALPNNLPLFYEVRLTLHENGYKMITMEDYLNNKVYKQGDDKNPLKIGKLLSKIDNELFKKYDISNERKDWIDILKNSDKALKIIISRHPYDLLGMASGRDWRLSSCMALGSSEDDKVYLDILASMGDRIVQNEIPGKYKDFIKKDIEYGTLVAYVVKAEDNNINNPISRLLIKPYVNYKDKNDIIWISSNNFYGKNVGGFKSSVDEWLGSWQREDFEGMYCINKDLYVDSKDREVIERRKIISKLGKKETEDFLNKVVDGQWDVLETGSIYVDGSVDIRGMGLTEIPVKFGYVSRDFNCSDNLLTTLKNAPNHVSKHFYCEGNNLTSLEFAPDYVGQDFWCYSQKNEHKFTEEEVRKFCRVMYDVFT
jgi:hypothetical protein